MRVLLFNNRFHVMICDQDKLQTCRHHAHCNPGDKLSLRGWLGKPYRSHQFLLAEATCQKVEPVEIDLVGPALFVRLYNVLLQGCDLYRFARADGFRDTQDMTAFFADQYPRMVRRHERFLGECIYWN